MGRRGVLPLGLCSGHQQGAAHMRTPSLLVVAAILFLGSCVSAPPQPVSMQDPQANFAAFKTFAWDTGQNPDVPGEPITIVNSQIRTAITSELQRKGYAEAAAGA